MNTTAFGAPFANPRTAATVLRAIAVRGGLELTDVSDVDCAAAVVAGDLWCRATGNTNLLAAKQATIGFKEAAGRILARAAGYGRTRGTIGQVGEGSAVALTMLEFYETWLETHVNGQSDLVLVRAGWDLICGEQVLDAAGATLQLAAEVP